MIQGIKVSHGYGIERGAWSKTVTPSLSTQIISIPEGHHNGEGKINVNAIVGGTKTITRVCNLLNHETFELVFDLRSQNKIHVCTSTFWAKGRYEIYGMRNGVYSLLETLNYGDAYETIGVFADITGAYENIKIVVVRDEIFNASCRYAVTVSTI